MRKFVVLAVLLLVLPAFAQEKRIAIPAGTSPSQGPENAPVTIVEFVDFQ